MAFEITVGPPLLSINHGTCVLVTEPSGQIDGGSDRGLYFDDTRLISAWSIRANGVEWDLLNCGAIAYFASRIFLTNRAIETADGPIAPQTLGLVIGRVVSNGVHEDLDLINYSRDRVRFNLEIMLRSDFADIFEVKAGKTVRRGQITTRWDPDTDSLEATYENADFRRVLMTRVFNSTARPVYANGRITFAVELEPGARWHACIAYAVTVGDRTYIPPSSCIDHCDKTVAGRLLERWHAAVTRVQTDNEEFYRLYHQAVDDLAALRLPIQDDGESEDTMSFVPCAGVPWFVALFGRDSLIASLQTTMIYPDFARGTLDVLGRYQATERDDDRDAEPGKIMHELRKGELAQHKIIPHTPYYGTADATPLYLILLHKAWCWTGDSALLDRHHETALRCLDWIDRYGDRDGDGFVEYETRSKRGYENQGWKDAGDAVVDENGRVVEGSKALCELQGYVYDAWLCMAEIFSARGDAARAAELTGKANDLFDRFNATFWDDELGFYIYGLDRDKRPIRTVASNPGHCLWSGIVPPDRAARVVARLKAPDMWSGWGIRTLSAENPAYNPYSYQNGSVWPHDNGVIAVGFKRYGFAAEAAQVARDISEAGSYFALHRLPELYAGLQRDGTNFPVQYLGANVPQAWAAGSVFAMLYALLGLVPNAAENILYVDPVLPAWLPRIELQNLQVGKQRFALKFWREGEETRFAVTDGEAPRVLFQPVADGMVKGV